MSARTTRALLEKDLLELRLLDIRRRLVQAHNRTHKPDVRSSTRTAISSIDTAIARLQPHA